MSQPVLRFGFLTESTTLASLVALFCKQGTTEWELH
jgi:hypothetical protein